MFCLASPLGVTVVGHLGQGIHDQPLLAGILVVALLPDLPHCSSLQLAFHMSMCDSMVELSHHLARCQDRGLANNA